MRTFAPLVVGAAEMPYSRYLPFSILGGLFWISSMVLAGYFLGGVIERALNIKLEDHIEKVVIVVVPLSLLPPLIEFLATSIRQKPRQRECKDAKSLTYLLTVT